MTGSLKATMRRCLSASRWRELAAVLAVHGPRGSTDALIEAFTRHWQLERHAIVAVRNRDELAAMAHERGLDASARDTHTLTDRILGGAPQSRGRHRSKHALRQIQTRSRQPNIEPRSP